MKRAVLYDIQKLAIEDAPEPPCPDDGLIVQVKACAVCATDVKIYNYGHPLIQLPRVLGHEVAGTIDQVGTDLPSRFSPGQRVAVCAVINCGRCLYCQRAVPSMCVDLKAFGYHFDGGYQEYMVVPNEAIRCAGVNVIPEDLPFAEASLAEPLACCINGQRLSNIRLGQSMLIIGAGPVGILHAQLAGIQGASEIYVADILPQKLQTARAVCCDAISGALLFEDADTFVTRIGELTNGRGFDQIIICCSDHQAQQVSLECVARCGCVNFFGGLPKGNSRIVLDTNHIHYKQCRVVGTHGSSAEDNRIALDLIAKGTISVKGLITETIDLVKLQDILAISDSNSKRLKSVVTF